ncbi:hypothetical protein Peur_005401 [Populus x canadensis]
MTDEGEKTRAEEDIEYAPVASPLLYGVDCCQNRICIGEGSSETVRFFSQRFLIKLFERKRKRKRKRNQFKDFLCRFLEPDGRMAVYETLPGRVYAFRFLAGGG